MKTQVAVRTGNKRRDSSTKNTLVQTEGGSERPTGSERQALTASGSIYIYSARGLLIATGCLGCLGLLACNAALQEYATRQT